MRESVSDEGLLPIQSAISIRKDPDARSADQRIPCSGSHGRTYSTLFTNKSPITPELRYLTAKMAALLPFGKAADLLGELLPLSAVTAVSTIRNRTMKVGRRLRKAADVLATAAAEDSCKDLVIGLDGGYVKSRHPRPERNFEIVAGKVLDSQGNATRFAFARNGGADGANIARLALRKSGANETTSVAFLTDGDAGLRAIHQQVAPEAEHILDWFHIAMRFTNLQQIAKGASILTDGGVRMHALTELERAKWRFWNGYKKKGLIGLVHLRHWALAHCFDHIPALKKLATRPIGNDPLFGAECRFDAQLRQALSQRISDIHRFRRVFGERNHCQANGQAPTDALEQTYSPELPGRPHSRPQRHLGRRVSPLASRLPPDHCAARRCMSAPQVCMLSAGMAGLH